MSTTQPFCLRWGIISTGNIAEAFVKDLLIDPKTRDVHDVLHRVVAVGSRTVERAQEFIHKVAGADKSIKAYWSYEGVYKDKEVDVVYIGTPHTFHFINSMDALKSRKHVLCEKPVTCNAAELRALIATAKANNVFFMEAMWTRFQPLTLRVKEIAEKGTLGLPVLLHADLSENFNINNIPRSHRILDPGLGGGALLDLGPYPLFWAILALYENPANNNRSPTHISSSMLHTPITGVDSSTIFNLLFSGSELTAQASLSCNITLHASELGVTIRFERGSIIISTPIYCPTGLKVQYFDEHGKIEREETLNFRYVGKGWHFQADEVARCVRDNKKESALWGFDKSLLEMTIFDEVRRQGGYNFPPHVEQVRACTADGPEQRSAKNIHVLLEGEVKTC